MSTNSSRTLHDDETLSIKNVEVIGSSTATFNHVRSNSVTSMRRTSSRNSLSNSSVKPIRSKRVSNAGPMGRGLVSSKSFINSPGVRPIELESIRSQKKKTRGVCSIPLTVTFLSVSLVFLSTLIVWGFSLGIHFQISSSNSLKSMSNQTIQAGKALQYFVNSLSRDLKDLISLMKIHSVSQELSSYSQVEIIRNLLLQKSLALGQEIEGIFISYETTGDLIATKTLTTESFQFHTIIQSLSTIQKLSQEIKAYDARGFLVEKTLSSLPIVNNSLLSVSISKSKLSNLCSESSSRMKIISPTLNIDPVISPNIGAISQRLYNTNNVTFGCIGYIFNEDSLQTLLDISPPYGFVVVKNNNPLITTGSDSLNIDTEFVKSFKGSIVKVDLSSSNLVSSSLSSQDGDYDGYWNLIMTRTNEDSTGTGFMSILIALVPMLTIISALTSYLVVEKCFMGSIRSLSESFIDLGKLKLESDRVIKTLSLKSQFIEISQLVDTFRGMHCNIGSFTKYVPICVSQELMANRKTAVLGLEDVLCVVSFLDIKNFTSYSEKLTPNQLVRVMSDAFEGLTSLVLDGGGVLDKYIGDCVMSFYECQNGGLQKQIKIACQVSVASVRYLKSMWKIWEREGLPQLECRIGLNCGPVKRGNFGSNSRFQYTILGDVVNVTSRLEGLNKRYGTEILVTETMYQTVGQFQMMEQEGKKQNISKTEQRNLGLFKSLNIEEISVDEMIFRKVDNVAVKGKDTFLPCYSILDRCDIPTKQIESFFEKDLQLYCSGVDALLEKCDPISGLAFFEQITWKDNLVLQKIDFCKNLIETGSTWDGYLRMDEK